MSCGAIVVRAHLSDCLSVLSFLSVRPRRHNAAGCLHIAYREVK